MWRKDGLVRRESFGNLSLVEQRGVYGTSHVILVMKKIKTASREHKWRSSPEISTWLEKTTTRQHAHCSTLHWEKSNSCMGCGSRPFGTQSKTLCLSFWWTTSVILSGNRRHGRMPSFFWANSDLVCQFSSSWDIKLRMKDLLD